MDLRCFEASQCPGTLEGPRAVQGLLRPALTPLLSQGSAIKSSSVWRCLDRLAWPASPETLRNNAPELTDRSATDLRYIFV